MWFIVSVQRPKGEMILFTAKKFIVKKRQCVVYGVENENHLL